MIKPLVAGLLFLAVGWPAPQEDYRYVLIVRAKSRFVQHKVPMDAFLKRLKKEVPGAEFQKRDAIPGDNAGWEDWNFLVDPAKKFDVTSWGRLFSDVKVGGFLVRIVGAVAIEPAKKTLILDHSASGMKFRLGNRAKRKDEKEDPPDLVAKITAWIKEGKSAFKVYGEISPGHDLHGLSMESAEEAAVPKPPEPKK